MVLMDGPGLQVAAVGVLQSTDPQAEIPKLFPPEVPPELQRLLTLLLHEFQLEWREDASKDQTCRKDVEKQQKAHRKG
ncbi:hypothetical protein TRIUR3_01516 [Triticum urartu]|uniref:Uncharacterized protein n=1 Tax=Triticum urartu TaxID=4572 RepID=M7ZHF1_TRIUA|nr:hypothetical protein TRIUR3_01516 [Triticum urartu]